MADALITLTQPAILFFLLGLFAALVRSDLTIPEAIAKGMSIYLMVSIGLKGGVEVASSGVTTAFLVAALGGVVLGFLIPLPAYWLLRHAGGLGRTDAGAVAAHYGSVSVVTFVTATDALTALGMMPDGHMVAVMALMETPAIISGLLLARGGGGFGRKLWHDVLFNASVILLIGAFLIGLAAGKVGYQPISFLFGDLFRGVLCLFLLDMGLLAARRLMEARALNARLLMLAIALPLGNGAAGVLFGTMLGMQPGSAAALGILAASASYIAVPAAMRVALPQANPGIYLGMSLGITFPFNILIGIPYCAWLAEVMTR